MLNPPLMLSTCPVIQPLCGEASSVTIGATSPGRPSRRSGYSLISFSRLASTQFLSCGVSTSPSETVFAVVPERPNSRANDFINAMTPARAAATIAKPELADPRGIAHDADDAAVLGGIEMRCRGMAAVNRTVQASVDLAMPILGLGLDEAPAECEPRIVDQDVEAAEIFDDLVDHRLDGGKVGDVGLISFDLAAPGRDLADQGVRILC